MFLLCLKHIEAFEDYMVGPSMQSHAALLVVLFIVVTGYALVRTFWEEREEKD